MILNLQLDKAIAGLHFMSLFYEISYAAFIEWFFFIFIHKASKKYISRIFIKLQKKCMLSSDNRVKFIGELIRGIQVTKMYCW